MHTLIENETASADAGLVDPSVESVSTYVFELVDEGAFTGTVRVAARLAGRGRAGAGTYPFYLAITNRNTGAIVDGDTGVTAAGLYSVDLSGAEAQIEVTLTTGAYSVYGKPLIG